MTRALAPALLLALLTSVGCENTAEKSVQQAKSHVQTLANAAREDVREVRDGLPKGAERLAQLYQSETPPKDDLQAVRDALEAARGAVQDLRVAKSTFFALAEPSGSVLRNDQEQDLMVGKNLFAAYPALKQAAQGRYVETRGSMKEAARVKGPDGQWVAAAPVKASGAVVGVYVTGWSWSAYAYRLETQLRGEIRSSLDLAKDNEPLVYVYVVVAKDVYGAPISPRVNAEQIAALDPLGQLRGEAVFTKELEITGRDFGLAVQAVPALGEAVGIAVLRSET